MARVSATAAPARSPASAGQASRPPSRAAMVSVRRACEPAMASTARSRARAADKRLRDAISEVSEEMVVKPIEAELASYATVREGLATSLR